MAFIVDASMAASWMLADERSEPTDAVQEQLERTVGHVPSLFWHEVRNLLLKAERKGRLSLGEAEAHLLRLREFPLQDAGPQPDAPVFALARAHGLRAYDAAYLALATASGLPIATTDRRLAEAARAENIALLVPFAP